mgnify:CR=1 FL=1
MAKDFKFLEAKYTISINRKLVICHIPVAKSTDNIFNLEEMIDLNYRGGGISADKNLVNAFNSVLYEGGLGVAEYKDGDTNDIEFAKKIAHKKAERNLHSKIAHFYFLFAEYFNKLQWSTTLSSVKHRHISEEYNEQIRKKCCENNQPFPKLKANMIGLLDNEMWFKVWDMNGELTLIFENAYSVKASEVSADGILFNKEITCLMQGEKSSTFPIAKLRYKALIDGDDLPANIYLRYNKEV